MRYLILFFALPFITYSQVGINTDTPAATLDVQGDVQIDQSLFLENPGSNDDIRNSLLLLKTSAGDIAQYDIESSKYGPINYSQYVFKKVGTDGLQDFDTKISINEYVVTVQGFYFLSANDDKPDSTNVLLQNENDLDNIEGYQFYAYKNTTTGTWFLKALVNNSDFAGQYTTYEYFDTVVDIYLNVVIYRQRLITKSPSATPVVVNMSNSETAVAPLPAGF